MSTYFIPFAIYSNSDLVNYISNNAICQTETKITGIDTLSVVGTCHESYSKDHLQNCLSHFHLLIKCMLSRSDRLNLWRN